MKIGIIGINRYAKFLNFACDLHVYGFQQFLTQNGYESTILDYKPVYFGNFDMRHPADYAEAKYQESVLREVTTKAEISARKRDVVKWAELAVGYRSAYVERERRYDKFEAFVADNLVFTEQVYNSDRLEFDDPGFDCYVCVTDVIWQPMPNGTFDRGFLLGSKAFEGKAKIAYAPSRGATKDFAPEQKKAFFEYIEDFDAVSSRERDFGEYIESNSEISAPTVLDPVMLHDKSFWQGVSTKPREEKFVLVYYVMERSTDTVQKAVEYAKLHDLTLVELSDRPLRHGLVTDPDVKHVSRYDVGMEEWLGYIEHAEAVFTNSFHGCCFSLLFEKTFYVGRRNGQKVPNFLATFDLSDRRFEPDADVTTLNSTIDYAAVNKILAVRREQSANFILTALSDAEQKLEAGRKVDHAKYDAKRHRISYPIRYFSGATETPARVSMRSASKKAGTQRFDDGNLEYERVGRLTKNNGARVVGDNLFKRPGHRFTGWALRFKVDNRWFWLVADGTFEKGDAVGDKLRQPKALLSAQDKIPFLPVNHVGMVVLVAQWQAVAPSSVQRAVRDSRSLADKGVNKAKRTARRVLKKP